MFGGVTQGDESSQSEGDKQITGVIEGLLKQYLDGPLLLLANAKVYWQEGAKTISMDSQLLLTNQQKVNELIKTLGAVSGGGGIPGITPPAGAGAGGASSGGSSGGNGS